MNAEEALHFNGTVVATSHYFNVPNLLSFVLTLMAMCIGYLGVLLI